ncbi:MAG TPA: hypothetical protein VN622_11090 [Clostridia bacterium]|nr:hypothetical protein [Clostridia bacterium]
MRTFVARNGDTIERLEELLEEEVAGLCQARASLDDAEMRVKPLRHAVTEAESNCLNISTRLRFAREEKKQSDRRELAKGNVVTAYRGEYGHSEM